MSNFKKSLDSQILKEKFSNLLSKLDRVNTSRMIIERHYANLSSLEIAEGKITATDAYAELKGIGVEQNKARHMVTASTLNEKKTVNADQYLLQRVAILETACKDLRAYDWMKPVGEFIKETQEFLKRNELSILIERIIFDLEMDRNANYYKKAIDKLVESSSSENPIFFIIENLESEKWIPLVKKLYEYAEKSKGSVNGHNPNFTVSRIYSPVEFVQESEKYAFFVDGKLFETDGNLIEESASSVSESFKKLVKITETANFSNKMLRLYPNANSIIDVSFDGETPKVMINNKVVESSTIESQLMAGGYIKYYETGKIAEIMHAITEGRNIKELDFGYRVTSKVFEGLTANIFNINENVYIQKINKGMKENSLVLAESAENAVEIVKEFMNYDISGSITHLLETEKSESELRSKEIAKIEGRIKFLMESRENLERVAKLNGVENTEKIKSAITLLESQLEDQTAELKKVTGTGEITKEESVNEDHCVPGKEYKIKDEAGWVYQGETDGVHIFNNDKGGKQPMTYDEAQWKAAHETGEITECA
jgi:hypothetical protein